MTLQLLDERGYDRMTVDAVAAAAHASKATLYRRWPTKADLVSTAVVEALGHAIVTPDTGTLRGDLLSLGEALCRHLRQYAGAIRAVLVEVSRNRALSDALQHQLISKPKTTIKRIVRQAIDRGEIHDGTINAELWDLLPGYLIFRAITLNRPPTNQTVRSLVDDVIVPSLTRRAR